MANSYFIQKRHSYFLASAIFARVFMKHSYYVFTLMTKVQKVTEMELNENLNASSQDISIHFEG